MNADDEAAAVVDVGEVGRDAMVEYYHYYFHRRRRRRRRNWLGFGFCVLSCFGFEGKIRTVAKWREENVWRYFPLNLYRFLRTSRDIRHSIGSPA